MYVGILGGWAASAKPLPRIYHIARQHQRIDALICTKPTRSRTKGDRGFAPVIDRLVSSFLS
jgi:hypothetical protein